MGSAPRKAAIIEEDIPPDISKSSIVGRSIYATVRSVKNVSALVALSKMGSGVSAGEKPEIVAAVEGDRAKPQIPDARLPFKSYRELFTLRNYWKTVVRNKETCAKSMFLGYLKSHQGYHKKYKKLQHLDLDNEDAVLNDLHFEKVAIKYLQVFDSTIKEVEAKSGDVSEACEKLKEVGSLHKSLDNFDSNDFKDLEKPFLNMVSETLGDRYNDKAEDLFTKFFKFCLANMEEAYLLEGWI